MSPTRSHTPIVLLTGNALRHRYVAERLARTLDLVGIVSEGKAPVVQDAEQVPLDELADMERHLNERDQVERIVLGEAADFPGLPRLDVPHGQSNEARVLEWVSARRPTFLILFGTSIIRAPLLAQFADRIVNVHLGLSPYYRGTATNFWPLVDRVPECVGATLHLAAPKVDAGAILAQVRPPAIASDRAHELGCKTIIAATAILPAVLDRFTAGALEPARQNLSGGRVCRRRDFNAAAVRQMWRNFADRMMPEYIADRARRNQRFSIREFAG